LVSVAMGFAAADSGIGAKPGKLRPPKSRRDAVWARAVLGAMM
jgi:hypothetical protein